MTFYQLLFIFKAGFSWQHLHLNSTASKLKKQEELCWDFSTTSPMRENSISMHTYIKVLYAIYLNFVIMQAQSYANMHHFSQISTTKSHHTTYTFQKLREIHVKARPLCTNWLAVWHLRYDDMKDDVFKYPLVPWKIHLLLAQS